MNSIAFAVIVLVVLGLAGGIILVLASKFMAVYEDPRIAQITECLARRQLRRLRLCRLC